VNADLRQYLSAAVEPRAAREMRYAEQIVLLSSNLRPRLATQATSRVHRNACCRLDVEGD
jgi:cytidylate kinase